MEPVKTQRPLQFTDMPQEGDWIRDFDRYNSPHPRFTFRTLIPEPAKIRLLGNMPVLNTLHIPYIT